MSTLLAFISTLSSTLHLPCPVIVYTFDAISGLFHTTSAAPASPLLQLRAVPPNPSLSLHLPTTAQTTWITPEIPVLGSLSLTLVARSRWGLLADRYGTASKASEIHLTANEDLEPLQQSKQEHQSLEATSESGEACSAHTTAQ